MIKAKINGKAIQIPETWEEVTFGKFLELIEIKDDYQAVLSVLLQRPLDEVKRAKFDGLERLIPALKFLQEPSKIDPHPTMLGNYRFPKDITLESVEKLEALRSEIRSIQGKTVKEATEALAMYAAIYITEPYDEEKARYMAKTFHELPCTEVMAAGNFFMTKVLSMQSGLPMNYLRQNILLKKSKPGFRHLMRRLASMLHLT